MMKRLAAAGVLTAAIGGVLFGATPAMAHTGGNDFDYINIGDKSNNFQGIGVQTCRDVNVAVIGAVIDNVLAVKNNGGECNNGSTDFK